MPIYIDIETLPMMDYEIPKYSDDDFYQEPPLKLGNLKDPQKIKIKKEAHKIKIEEARNKAIEKRILAEEAEDKKFRKTAFDSMKGEILCISFAVDNSAPVSFIAKDTNFKHNFIQFWSALEEETKHLDYLHFVGHNVEEFDLSWIWRKAIQYECQGASAILQAKVSDTIKIWAKFQRKNFVSMDNLAHFLNIPGKGDVDGSMVYDLWLAGKLKTIAEYCESDVEMVRKIYKRIMQVE
jgi:hypothetical protein